MMKYEPQVLDTIVKLCTWLASHNQFDFTSIYAKSRTMNMTKGVSQVSDFLKSDILSEKIGGAVLHSQRPGTSR
jgi:hypothetical protein